MITLENLQYFGNVSDAIQFAQNTKLEYPARVSKPVLKDTNNVEALMTHVEALKQYDIEKAKYDIELKAYNDGKNATNNVIVEFIKDESGLNNIPEQYQDKVWYKAWRDGHSDGYYSVYQELLDLVDIFMMSERITND
jgi:hypothetical protein